MEVHLDLGLLCHDRSPLRTKSPANSTYATEKVKLHACCGYREFCRRSGTHEGCESCGDETSDGFAGGTVRLEQSACRRRGHGSKQANPGRRASEIAAGSNLGPT